jgi:hypothetical protein
MTHSMDFRKLIAVLGLGALATSPAFPQGMTISDGSWPR